MAKPGAIWVVLAAACLPSLIGCGELGKHGATPSQAGHGSGGTATSGGQTSDGGNTDCIDSQGHAPGSADETFGVAGFALLPIAPMADAKRDPTLVSDMALAANGDIVVVAQHGLGCSLFRLDKDGRPDATFGTQGRVDITLNLGGFCLGLKIDPQGRLLVSGSERDDAMVARFTANGAPDPTFGTIGRQLIDFGSNNDRVSELLVREDESLVAVGSRDSNAEVVGTALVVLGADGAPGPVMPLEPGPGRQFPVGLVELPDHSLLVLGQNQTASSAFLTKRDAEGAAVADFGDAGWLRSADKTFNGVVTLLAHGTNATAWGYASGYQTVRLDADGTYAVFSVHNAVIPMSVAQQCDGKLLIAGTDGNLGGELGRLTAAGNLDATFELHTWPKGDGVSQMKRVSLQPDGKVVAAGNIANLPVVTRLWP